jgi:hypothetical protein
MKVTVKLPKTIKDSLEEEHEIQVTITVTSDNGFSRSSTKTIKGYKELESEIDILRQNFNNITVNIGP